MSGELFAVRLLKPWGDRKPGELVLVDRLRAVTLEQDGLGSIEPPATDAPQRCVTCGDVLLLVAGKAIAHLCVVGTKAPAEPPKNKMERGRKAKA